MWRLIMGKARLTGEVKVERAEAKKMAKALAKAIADATPEAMAKAEAKRLLKATRKAVAEAKAAEDALISARDRAIAASIRNERIVKWSIDDHLCLLFAVFYVLDSVGKDIMTLGGTVDIRVLLQSVMATQGRALLYGVTSNDIHCLMMKVVEENRVRGREVGFVWKRVGLRKHTGKGWDVGSMKRTVLNKFGKKFVMLGKTVWGNEAQRKKMARLRNLSEIEICEVWGEMKSAWGLSAVDHAVAVRIEAREDDSRLIDNGCSEGMRLFTMTNLALRMTDLGDCFELDVFDV